MRASKLITLSAVAALMGGTSFALGEGSLQSGSSLQKRSSSMSQGSVQQKFPGSQAGRQKTASLRSQQRQSIGPKGAYARGSARELESSMGAGLSTEERSRLRDMAREIPRISNVGTEIRIDAVVPRSVRMAAAPLPPEVRRMHPRFRRDRAFIYRGQVVIVNPATSRIVAIIKA